MQGVTRMRSSTGVAVAALSFALAIGSTALAAPSQPCSSPPAPRPVTATFLGVSSILIDDGERQVLIDGFFSRPSPLTWPFNLHPNEKRIAEVMKRAQICRLDAIVVGHAHHDHVLDAPDIAKKTGAVVAGSRSVGMVARGRGRALPPEKILQLNPGDTLVCGRFRILAIASRHPPGFLPSGEIVKPVSRDAGVTAYGAGANLAFYVQHPDHVRTLIVPSADPDIVLPATLEADTVMLGVGFLGHESKERMTQYWRRTVVATKAQKVAPIHWDNLSGELAKPLRLAPRPIDQVRKALSHLETVKGTVEMVRLDAYDQLILSSPAAPGPRLEPARQGCRAESAA